MKLKIYILVIKKNKLMKIHKEHVIFDQIATMLHSLYSNDPKYRNTVFVLGYNVMAGNSIERLRKQYPSMKLIIIQLEQLFVGSPWVTKRKIEFLQQCDEIWDYDESNIAFLKTRFNITAKLFTLKYVPELNVLPLLPKQDHDIDILYYGAFNDRRQIALNNIRTLMPDKNIITTDSLWGDELNDAIHGSKIIVNLHFFEQNRQEQARLFYLMCNHKCIVSETSIINYYGNGIIESNIDNIHTVCKQTLDSGVWYDYAKQSLKSIIFSNEYYKDR